MPEDERTKKRVLAERDRFAVLFYVDPAPKKSTRLDVPTVLGKLIEEMHGDAFWWSHHGKGVYKKLSRRYW